jgi:alkylated DNA nucleotide flippase Atl1
MSTKTKRTWQEKLADSKDLPKVVPITGKMSTRWGTGTVVVPAPKEVDELMGQVQKGKVVTVNRLREALAKKHGATIGCPMTTGIFSWIAAHAAVEAQAQGKKQITPWWRTLKADGELNPKFPGGVEAQAALLQAEGHTLVAGKGKKPPRVADLEARMGNLG